MPMNVPAGQRVFLDCTILHYAFVDFAGATSQCLELLQRAARGELAAGLTIPVLNDAVHKTMCSEAMDRFGRPRAGLVRWLVTNPDLVKQLTNANGLLTFKQTTIPYAAIAKVTLGSVWLLQGRKYFMKIEHPGGHADIFPDNMPGKRKDFDEMTDWLRQKCRPGVVDIPLAPQDGN